MRYRPELDGMRALAVVAVIASHLALPYADGGWMGVDVFFVLSGFLITSLLLDERARFGAISLGRFYSRRALRLYPALIAVIVVGAFFFPLIALSHRLASYAEAATAAGLYVSDFVAGTGHSQLLAGFGHTWSLAVEEHFYLLWPPALTLLLRFRRNVLGWTMLAAALSLVSLVALSFLRSPDGLSDAAYYLPSSRFWTLLLGCIVALLLHRGVRVAALERSTVGIGLAAAAAALLLAAGRFERYPNFAWEAPAIGLLAAAGIWHVTASEHAVVRRLLAWKPLVWLGRRSYGVYLYHLPVLLVLQSYFVQHPVRHLVVALAVYVVTIAVAALAYQFLELPFLRLKNRFAARRRDPAPEPAAQSLAAG